ncbi:hypothetical protein [Bacillus fonticola]|uniref:hypothetical protein n=1 Tax=Bacillus fonticola TaxID=2728853 RepID=UPI001476229F|nr:hypothetical protein [Bacillus fonticola]
MFRRIQMTVILSLVFLLTGCMYPQEELARNQTPYEDQIQSVQSSVTRFQEANGILPIKTREMDTPIYRKYPIDFKRIVPSFQSEVPTNAFENGGVFQYVLVDVEEDPQVKLFDLRLADAIRELKFRIDANTGYPPYGEEIADSVFTLRYEELGLEEGPTVLSPYTQQQLPLIVGPNGEVYIDYRSDVARLIQEGTITPEQGGDLREQLVERSAFVPAYSLPIVIGEGREPVYDISFSKETDASD